MKILDMKTILGYVGAGVAGLLPLVQTVSIFIQIIAGAGGLVLLGYSIRHKIIQIKIHNAIKNVYEDLGYDLIKVPVMDKEVRAKYILDRI